MTDRYVSNPRHKQPWQPGARGTLCPPGVSGAELFATATADVTRPGKRYGTDGERAYCAHPNVKNPGEGQEVVWHGFPVPWSAVPVVIQLKWVDEGLITKVRKRG